VSWNPTNIMVAVDGSEQSVHAAAKAVDLARTTGGKVTVATVVRPPEGWWGLEGSPPSPEAMAAAVAAGRREVLEGVLGKVNTDGVDITTMEEIGDPASMIITLCEQEDIDLLVIGRRGAGFVERMMIGSVADRLAHHSPCPIMIVP